MDLAKTSGGFNLDGLAANSTPKKDRPSYPRQWASSHFRFVATGALGILKRPQSGNCERAESRHQPNSSCASICICCNFISLNLARPNKKGHVPCGAELRVRQTLLAGATARQQQHQNRRQRLFHTNFRRASSVRAAEGRVSHITVELSPAFQVIHIFAPLAAAFITWRIALPSSPGPIDRPGFLF